MLYKRIISTNTPWLVFCQKLSLTTESYQTADTENAPDETTRKKPSKRNYYSKDVYNYLQKNFPQHVDEIPKLLVRRATGHSNNLYIINETSAKALASMISEELSNDSSHVIECNPGLGLLTKELLKTGVPCIHLYEAIKPFCEGGRPLSMLMKEHPDRLTLKELNFFKIWKLLLRDQFLETTHTEDYLVDVPYSQWNNSTYMQLINFCPNRKFISLLIHNFFNHTNLFERGRPCFYLAAPSPVWQVSFIL